MCFSVAASYNSFIISFMELYEGLCFLWDELWFSLLPFWSLYNFFLFYFLVFSFLMFHVMNL